MEPLRKPSHAALCALLLLLLGGGTAHAQSFSSSTLDFDSLGGVSSGTSLSFGPDGRLYVLQIDGTLDVFSIQRDSAADYRVIEAEEILAVKTIPNHNDDGTPDAGSSREATGLVVVGTASNPVVYATSSDARIGGPSGDKNLDTNSGVITRLAWQGSDLDDPSGYWEPVDIVRGLARSEENHALNGLEFVTLGGSDYLIVCAGGHTNAGSPSTNFAWSTEYALSAAVLAIDLAQIEALPTLNDGTRDYIYDLPTLDDPTRTNANSISDPADPGYDGIDVDDPWGGNDGLNQAKLVPGGPVQIFSPGYRNTYDLVVTASGAVYVTDNGANSGWGGYPDQEGVAGNATNAYRPGEPGSTGTDAENGDAVVNNQDHLTLITTDIDSYVFGSFYGGHPAPVRANPAGAGLFTRGSHSSDPGDSNGNSYTDDWFRTLPYDPAAGGDAADPQRALPADWPPVPVGLADPVQGDFRNPGGSNPDGPDDAIVTTWQNNSNGIDEYTASNFGGAMQGDLIAGRNGGGNLHRIQLNPDGSLASLTQNYISGLGGNALGVTANGDSEVFPGTIWVATFNSDIVVLEPQDFVICVMPGDPGYDAGGDNDSDGYTNQDEEDNATDPCNGGSQPNDFDKVAGAPLVSDLNDLDDDADGSADAADPFQLGNPGAAGSDAFALPVDNELFSDNPALGGYLGLGFTGLMNNGAANPNWLDWVDQTGAGPNPNDILGGAVGAMTMQMTAGSARGAANDQAKGFQYGVEVDLASVGFTLRSRLLNLDAGLQLYPFAGPGALGIFLGDGSQSNFIQLVVDANGVELVQEVGDVLLAPVFAPISTPSRPTSSLEFEIVVDSTTGEVEAWYGIDGGPLTSVGSVFATGATLAAIQQTGVPLAVGLTGSSNTPGAEVEGTWDYLSVVGRVPSASPALPDVTASIGGPTTQDIDLDAYFDDDGGDANLSYSITSETDPAIGASISGDTLTLSFPAFAASSTITLRATDLDGLWVEQSFVVSLADPIALFRLNAGGGAVAAIDAGIDWEADTTGNNSAHLALPGGNNSAAFDVSTFAPEVDLASTPAVLYQTERWSSAPGNPSMTYEFPLPQPGHYEVRLYMGNGWDGANDPGERVFSVELDGMAFGDLTDVDLSATFGHKVGGVVSHTLEVTDGLLEIDFFHGSANNPMLNAIEIIGGVGPPAQNPIVVGAIANQAGLEGDPVSLPVVASGGDSGGTFGYSAAGLPPGLFIHPLDGVISGTLASGAATGSPYAVSVSVDDEDADAGDAESVFFSWSVADPLAPVWLDLDEDENYTARHECSFVQAGNHFYMFGGRENAQTLDTYDFASDSWSTSAAAPLPFNHFQATEYAGLVWVIGAFKTNSFPNEQPADEVRIYDPANDVWHEGPTIPISRRRGSAGLVVHDGKFYVAGGNTIGHNGGYVAWFDEYDPETGSWTPLADAPHARDHFHAAVADDKLYLIGGRLSGGPGGTFAPLIAEVDVYDFATATWSTLPSASDFPTPRAAAAVALFDDEILLIGGEGNGQAYTTVEAFDPATSLWRAAASLNYARHGTQAIVSGQGVYVAGGSPNQGGGNQKHMEAYNADAPSGTAPVAGSLAAPGSVEVASGGATAIALDHDGGTQGVFVTQVELTGPDAADFVLIGATGGFLVTAGGSHAVAVEYTGSASEAMASLVVTYGDGQTTSTALASTPVAVPVGPLAPAALLLLLPLLGAARLARRAR